MNRHQKHRILLIDDNEAIHDDFKKILGARQTGDTAFTDAKALLFDVVSKETNVASFEIDSAFQGQEGLALVEKSLAAGRPYALAFVDVRMPPGWDGVETIRHIWQRYPELQVVICTAYSDYSWDEIIKNLGQSDSLLILKKPFDNVEVLQLAHSLTKKWELAQQARTRLEDLDRLVNARTRELQLSEERFSKAFRSSPLPMIIQTLRDERCIDVNDSFLQLSGYTREEILQQRPADLGLWADVNAQAQFTNAIHQSKTVRNFRCGFRSKGGEVRETLLFAELFNLDAEPFLLTLVQDISERLQMEIQLRQSQKMEAIGQLAAGVAHDFNNLLTIIQGHVSLVLGTQKLDPKTEKSLKQTLGASERAGNLTRQLLAFSRKQVMERRAVRLDRLFEQVGGLLPRLIGENIAVAFHCPPGTPPIHADLSHIEQVLMNLAVNARDAMPNGGHLSISAGLVPVDRNYLASHPEGALGDFVFVRVTDTGCGMDAATKVRVFEPFFTTKGVGKGTGMGLATAYGIVKQHEGWIEVESEQGRGTTFIIYLPVSKEAYETTTIHKPVTAALTRSGNETVLVVEDETPLRTFVQTVLESHGYRVLLAGDAAEAVRVWDEHSQEINLLLTDMVMPGIMTGKELAERLIADKPELNIIFTSGYSLAVLGTDCRFNNGVSLLQKPYQVSVLVNTVRQSLDGETRAGGVVNKRWMMPCNA